MSMYDAGVLCLNGSSRFFNTRVTTEDSYFVVYGGGRGSN